MPSPPVFCWHFSSRWMVFFMSLIRCCCSFMALFLSSSWSSSCATLALSSSWLVELSALALAWDSSDCSLEVASRRAALSPSSSRSKSLRSSSPCDLDSPASCFSRSFSPDRDALRSLSSSTSSAIALISALTRFIVSFREASDSVTTLSSFSSCATLFAEAEEVSSSF
uniref:Putative secreted protein n=1 Tax=Ixodes ricinus TaxID=34613 RepID=A0A6B0UY09_IXORI